MLNDIATPWESWGAKVPKCASTTSTRPRPADEGSATSRDWGKRTMEMPRGPASGRAAGMCRRDYRSEIMLARSHSFYTMVVRRIMQGERGLRLQAIREPNRIYIFALVKGALQAPV